MCRSSKVIYIYFLRTCEILFSWEPRFQARAKTMVSSSYLEENWWRAVWLQGPPKGVASQTRMFPQTSLTMIFIIINGTQHVRLVSLRTGQKEKFETPAYCRFLGLIRRLKLHLYHPILKPRHISGGQSVVDGKPGV